MDDRGLGFIPWPEKRQKRDYLGHGMNMASATFISWPERRQSRLRPVEEVRNQDFFKMKKTKKQEAK
jgi:transposase